MKNALILAVLVVVGSAYTYYDSRHSSLPPNTVAETAGPAYSVPAPDFTFTDISGRKHRLDDFRGKAVVLNFWASWCAPCVQEMPQMFELARKTEETSVLLFLSLDEEKEQMERFLKKYTLDQPKKNIVIAIDTDKKISRDLFQTYKIPETYLIDSQGMIREKIIGLSEVWDKEETVQKVENLIVD